MFFKDLKVSEIINYINVSKCQEANVHFDLNKTCSKKSLSKDKSHEEGHRVMSKSDNKDGRKWRIPIVNIVFCVVNIIKFIVYLNSAVTIETTRTLSNLTS